MNVRYRRKNASARDETSGGHLDHRLVIRRTARKIVLDSSRNGHRSIDRIRAIRGLLRLSDTGNFFVEFSGSARARAH